MAIGTVQAMEPRSADALSDSVEVTLPATQEAAPDMHPMASRSLVQSATSALVQTASKSQQLAKGTARAFVERKEGPYHKADPFMQRQLYNELHAYPSKRYRVAQLIWFFAGIVGGHRFYLGKVGTAVLMLLTMGGGLIWWIIDAFLLKDQVQEFNDEQAQREAKDEPPIGMEFVPKVPPDALASRPAWAEQRTGQRGRFLKVLGLVGDACMVIFCGFMLGAFTEGAESNTVFLVVIALVLMINLADQLIQWYHIPVIRSVIRWDLKLRLFYQFNEPGRSYTLFFRPIVGIFYAPFSRKARAEVTLYLQIAGIVSAATMLAGFFTGEGASLFTSFSVSSFLEGWSKNNVIGFFTVFAFASPLGATLMKHTLLRRPNWVRWMLSALVFWALFQGLANG